MKLNPVDIYLFIFIKISNKMTIPQTSKTRRGFGVPPPPPMCPRLNGVFNQTKKKTQWIRHQRILMTLITLNPLSFSSTINVIPCFFTSERSVDTHNPSIFMHSDPTFQYRRRHLLVPKEEKERQYPSTIVDLDLLHFNRGTGGSGPARYYS
jgi:hypothetical protein